MTGFNPMSFEWPVRVYYEDTDAGGVVFYANYLKFMERARTEMLRDLGVEQNSLREQTNLVFVVRSVSIEYLRPALFNDLLNVSTEVVEMKKTTVVFKQTVWRDAEPICSAFVKIACVDLIAMKPKPIPQNIVENLT